METTNNTVKSETTEQGKANVEAAPANIVTTPAPNSTLKKVAFWGGVGVVALAVGAGIAYWLRSRNSGVAETAGETAEALRR